MSRYELRRVQSELELRAFAEGFSQALEARSRGEVKGHLALTYLQAAQVTGVFDAENRIVAGYAMGTSAPLRLLQFVPVEARARVSLPEGGAWDDCCELTCMWRSRVVSPLFMAMRVWPRALWDARRTGKRYMLGASQVARLDSIYAEIPGATLYTGPSVDGIPERLAAYDARRLWHQAAGVIVRSTFRRFLHALESDRPRLGMQNKGGRL